MCVCVYIYILCINVLIQCIPLSVINQPLILLHSSCPIKGTVHFNYTFVYEKLVNVLNTYMFVHFILISFVCDKT